jgi:hypothetical protein
MAPKKKKVRKIIEIRIGKKPEPFFIPFDQLNKVA